MSRRASTLKNTAMMPAFEEWWKKIDGHLPEGSLQVVCEMAWNAALKYAALERIKLQQKHIDNLQENVNQSLEALK